jgi:predicted nucleic-acid-binding protein
VINLDTNVLVRFLVDDDREQAERALAFLETCVRDDTPCLVTDIVVCETVWVLESCYRFGRSEIASTLGSLLRARQLQFQSPDLVSRALGRYATGPGDVADYLIDEEGRIQDCTATVTFDKDLAGDPRFITP